MRSDKTMSKIDKKIDWYKGPLTKKHIAELREKLGIARGLIEELREIVADPYAKIVLHNMDYSRIVETIDDVLNKTSDV